MTGMPPRPLPPRPGRPVTAIRPGVNPNPEPHRVTRRVLVGKPSPESRLYLEIDTTLRADLTRRFVSHIDDVRELLISGRITPDDAHAMLIDCTWALPTEASP